LDLLADSSALRLENLSSQISFLPEKPGRREQERERERERKPQKVSQLERK
jgi:hypothetical protein